MNPGNAYRENAVAGSSPVRLLVLLYDQLIKDVRQALAAMERGDIEVRTAALDHALLVLGHLHANVDQEHGGEAAGHLTRFYTLLGERLLEAQARVAPEILREDVQTLLGVREAWLEADRKASGVVVSVPSQASSERTGWTG